MCICTQIFLYALKLNKFWPLFTICRSICTSRNLLLLMVTYGNNFQVLYAVE